jgi:uncharacterized membrane protein (DUF485 family)
MLASKIIIGTVVGGGLIVGLVVFVISFIAKIIHFERLIREERTDELFDDE